MRIEQFDPVTDQRQLRACFEFTEAGWPDDHPDVAPWTLGSFTGKWTHGFDACPQQCWLATGEDGTPLGGYLLRLEEKENVTLAACIMIVSPDRRRAGTGRALAAHCAAQARLAGRTRLTVTARDSSPGAAMAAALGATPGIPTTDRILNIDDALPGRLAVLRAAAVPHAAGYTLASWRGPTPEEYLDQVARAKNAMKDAPRDAGVEPTIWDAGRVRESEQTGMASGLDYLTVMARHDASGEVAAMTQLCLDSGTPGWAFQMVTAVLPPHRGRRLGMLVKIANLDLLIAAAPQARRVFTGNASANQHMIAINAQLGFQAAAIYRDWELDLTAGPGLPPAAARQS
jgi:GNAT superfamily N-acetyltransferase